MIATLSPTDKIEKSKQFKNKQKIKWNYTIKFLPRFLEGS